MSKIQVDEIVDKLDAGAPTFTKGVSVTGIATGYGSGGGGSGGGAPLSTGGSGTSGIVIIRYLA
jgi:hypothetical protein